MSCSDSCSVLAATLVDIDRNFDVVFYRQAAGIYSISHYLLSSFFGFGYIDIDCQRSASRYSQTLIGLNTCSTLNPIAEYIRKMRVFVNRYDVVSLQNERRVIVQPELPTVVIVENQRFVRRGVSVRSVG